MGCFDVDFRRQISLFSSAESDMVSEKQIFLDIDLTTEHIKKFSVYNLDYYIDDLNTLGLTRTWNLICCYIKKFGENGDLLKISNFKELYELGLAVQDKYKKKKSGQYYTPSDVAQLMCKWFEDCPGDNVCDVGCGTGQLILTYLDLIGTEKALKLINRGGIYLYDIDSISLQICKTAILKKYSINDSSLIHDIHCDFLDADINLPHSAKVISNPPYAAIEKIKSNWNITSVMLNSKELYASFMEKIFQQAESSVVITPFSFISGNKFYLLRREMCKESSGFIVSFDNVPGNIFCGKKHGIFNTNTSNSVRAAITVLRKNKYVQGFRISPLIRFKNEERKDVLSNDSLENILPKNLQIVDNKNLVFEKVDVALVDIFEKWKRESLFTLSDFVSKNENDFLIDVPNTCRYYTTAAHRKLNRTGSVLMHVRDKRIFNFIYCFLNSSFAYWWWRIYDGGITYPRNLLLSIPLPINLLKKEDDVFFEEYCNKMIKEEERYIVKKMNAGAKQENIKFPESYRNDINKRILSILNFNYNGDVFSSIHANCFKNNLK